MPAHHRTEKIPSFLSHFIPFYVHIRKLILTWSWGPKTWKSSDLRHRQLFDTFVISAVAAAGKHAEQDWGETKIRSVNNFKFIIKHRQLKKMVPHSGERFEFRLEAQKKICLKILEFSIGLFSSESIASMYENSYNWQKRKKKHPNRARLRGHEDFSH